MKKALGVLPAVFPMPVLMVAAYDENMTVNVMNLAWGTICSRDHIALFIGENHKTTENIRKTGAFTVSLADRAHMMEADYFGGVSGKNVPDKFERAGFHAEKSSFVNAPVIEEFPVVLECELDEIIKNDIFYCVTGKILNVSAEERVLSEDGRIDPARLDSLMYDVFQKGYYAAGEKAGQAGIERKGLME